MAFPSLSSQQEASRKILEDLQLKKQQLQQKGSIASVGLVSSPMNSMPALGTATTEFNQIAPQKSMARIKLKKLEEYLQGVDGFVEPKILLEQYPTPPHIASCILYNIQAKYGDLENKLVGDLGCGCGMLTIGSFLLGAQLTIGFEIDSDAIDVLRANVTEMELPAIDCVQADILKLPVEKWYNAFDTIIMNPPFGTKNNAGIDMLFVEKAIMMSSNVVYSLHKTSTRDFIKKRIEDYNVQGEVIAELKYNIDASYKFHKNKSVDIEVDVWRFDVAGKNL